MDVIKQKEFCRLTGLTRKSLLIYEDKGLLRPFRVDEQTGYRYYGEDELLRASRISMLRTLLFGIDEIGEILDDPTQRVAHFAAQERKLALHAAQFSQGLAFLQLQEGGMGESLFEIPMHHPTHLVLEGRGRSGDISLHVNTLLRAASAAIATPAGTLFTFFYKDSCEDELHFKVCLPVIGLLYDPGSGCRIEQFGRFTLLSLRHFGSYELLPQRYRELSQKLVRGGHYCSGEYCEIYRTAPITIPGIPRDFSTLITDIGGVLC